MSVRVAETPVGPLTLVASGTGLRAVLWSSESESPAGEGEDPRATAILAATAAQLEEYFAGSRRVFDLPLDPAGTEFQVRAWQALAEIPYGETVSYGEQARRLGRPGRA